MYTCVFLFGFPGGEGYQRSGVSTFLPSFEGQHVLRPVTSHALGMFSVYSVMYH